MKGIAVFGWFALILQLDHGLPAARARVVASGFLEVLVGRFFKRNPPPRGKVCDFPSRTTTASPPRNPTQEVNIDPGPPKKTHHDPRESTQLQFLLHSMVTIQKTNIAMESHKSFMRDTSSFMGDFPLLLLMVQKSCTTWDV